MPNWCENRVSVSGDAAEITRFKELVGEDFDFDRIIPMPVLLKCSSYGLRSFEIGGETVNLDSWYQDPGDIDNARPFTEAEQVELGQIGWDNWYEWSCSNWGCKWRPNEVELWFDDAEFLEYSMLTPWSPPEGIHARLLKMFPSLSISWFWHEPGICEAGYL